MKSPTRQDIFAQAAAKLRAEFEELRVVPHAGTKGSEGEKIVRRFLAEHLPRRFAVGAGFMIDRFDHVSKQTDVIVYDSFNCPVYRAADDAAIIPNDNVAAVVEVKAYLDKEKLQDACTKLRSAKDLAKLQAPDSSRVLNATFGAVFAFSAPLELGTLADHYRDILRERPGIAPPADIIVVLDVGVVSFFSHLRDGKGWRALLLGDGLSLPKFEGAHIALCEQALGTNTLDWFLRWLLAHAALFRGVVDHPGFNWAPSVSQDFRFQYLGSVTHEKDPTRRDALLKEYAEDAKVAFTPKEVKPPEG